MKVLGLQNEMDGLKVVSDVHAKYLDTERRLTEIDEFAKRVSEMYLKESDTIKFLEQVENYRHTIMRQCGLERGPATISTDAQRNQSTQSSESDQNYKDIIPFLMGLSSVRAKRVLEEIYENIKEERIEDAVNSIYKKILEASKNE